MSYTSITYLLGQYWLYVSLALIIGAITGWFSTTGPKP